MRTSLTIQLCSPRIKKLENEGVISVCIDRTSACLSLFALPGLIGKLVQGIVSQMCNDLKMSLRVDRKACLEVLKIHVHAIKILEADVFLGVVFLSLCCAAAVVTGLYLSVELACDLLRPVITQYTEHLGVF